MSKSRIYILLGANTIVLYSLVLFLLRDATVDQWVVIGIAMVLMVILPAMLINRLVDSLDKSVKDKTAEAKALRQELESVKAKVAQVTTLDDLTGCYNKRHFMELLQQHRAMAERSQYKFTLVVAQVDEFTEIVDKYGLGRGHEVLQLFARIVKSALREVDVIARMESDIFSLILSDCPETDALNIINRISELVGQIQVTEEDDIKITASGGLTSYHGTESVAELIEHAEQALQFAIEEGRDRVAGYNYTPPAAEDA